jgi:hypothetical protein
MILWLPAVLPSFHKYGEKIRLFDHPGGRFGGLPYSIKVLERSNVTGL